MVGAEKDGAILLWDLESESDKPTVLPGSADRRWSDFSFSHDGSVFAASEPERITLWDWPNRTKIRELPQKHWMPYIDFSPVAPLLASVDDNDILLWDTRSWTVARTLSGHDRRIGDLSFSGDGKRLTSVSYDRTVRIWDPETGRILATIPGDDEILDYVTFLEDDSFLATKSSGSWRGWSVDADYGFDLAGYLEEAWFRFDERTEAVEVHSTLSENLYGEQRFSFRNVNPGSHLHILRAGHNPEATDARLLAHYVHRGNWNAAFLLHSAAEGLSEKERINLLRRLAPQIKRKEAWKVHREILDSSEVEGSDLVTAGFFASKFVPSEDYEKYFEKGIRSLKDHERDMANFTMGVALFNREEYEKAVDLFQPGSKLFGNDLDTFADFSVKLFRSVCYWQVGERDRALEEFLWIKTKFPPYYADRAALQALVLKLDETTDGMLGFSGKQAEVLGEVHDAALGQKKGKGKKGPAPKGPAER